MKRLRKRLLSLALAAAMVLTLLPAIDQPAKGKEMNVFEDLGFDTSSEPDGYVDNGSNPYGRDKVTMNPVHELFVGSDSPDETYNNGIKRTWGRYGHNAVMDSNQLKLSPTAKTLQGAPNKYDMYRTVVGDFTGSGKKDKIVALGANTVRDSRENKDDRGYRGLDMFFIEPKDGNQSQSGDVFRLYTGTIGNYYELKQGFLKFDGEKDKDNNSWSSAYYNPTMLQNYMELVTGDFTGDGIDEIAVYIPDHSNPRIEVYQIQYTGTVGDAWWSKSKWKLIYTHGIPITHKVTDPFSGQLITVTGAPNKVSMTAGDINYDGVDDLAVAYGGSDYTNEGTMMPFGIGMDGFHKETNGKVQVLFGTGAGSAFRGAVDVPYTKASVGRDDDLPLLANFSLAMGDLTGAGRDRLIIAETYEIKTTGKYRKADAKVAIQSFPYDPDSGRFSSAGLTVESDSQSISEDDVYAMVRSNAAALRPGPGQADLLYYRGCLYSANSSGVVTRSAKTVYNEHAGTLRAVNRDADYCAFYEYGITAVDIDNDFSEELVFTYNHVITNNDGPRAYPVRGLVLKLDEENEKSGLNVLRVFQGEPSDYSYSKEDFHWPRSCILMAVPDTDNDTMLLDFKEQHLSYSDPKLLAVMAGAPVYEDLEHLDDGDGYIGESYTSCASSKGSGTGSTSSKQFNVGAYFGYEHNVTIFGAPLFSVEFEGEYSHSITWETEKRSTISETVEYGTTGYTDSVALYSLPVAVYVYEATIPNNVTGGTTKQEFTVNLPFSPAVKVMSVEEYEEVAQNHAGVLPSVRGANEEEPILTHTQGKPDTYPKTAGAFENARVSSGEYAQVGYGNGYMTRSIEVEEEETTSTTHNDEISFRAGGGAGGFKAGITLGAAFGYGSAKITTNGNIFTGSVFNMPEEARGYGYVYSWKLLQYWHKFEDGNKVPVVTYLVETNRGGSAGSIPPPQNMDINVKDSTEDTLTLTWEYPVGADIQDFQVYRYNPVSGSYIALAQGVVSYQPNQGRYTYTDTGLSVGSEYSYRAQARRSSGPPSIHSSPVSGWTLASSGIKLTLDQYELKVYPDQKYTVTSTLTGADKASSFTYMWEKQSGGKWQETGINTKNLTMVNARPSASGIYRLRVFMEVDGRPGLVYSPALKVTANKRKASIAVTVAESGSSELLLRATVKNTENALYSGAVPTGPVTFEVSWQGEEAVSYNTKLTGNIPNREGSASLTVPGVEAGAYEVKAFYGGNAAFESVESQPARYLKGSESYYYLSAPKDMYYGDTAVPRCYKVSRGADNSTVSEEIRANQAGYTFEVASVMRQQITVAGDRRTVSFVPDSSQHVIIYSNSLNFSALRLDPNNFTNGLDIGVGNDYHYEIAYNIRENGQTVATLSHRFIIHPRPLTVTPKGGEVEQSKITDFTDGDFTLTSPLKSPLGFTDRLMNLITPQVSNNQGAPVSWNSSLPLGNYTVTVSPKTSTVQSAYYDFTFLPASLAVTGRKYNATLKSGIYGIASPAQISYTAGTRLTFNAKPNTGYEVDKWVAKVGGNIHHQQTGGIQFRPPTLAADMTVEVTFKQKNTVLSYETLPVAWGRVDTSVGNGERVMEGTNLTLTAIPNNPGYQLSYWRVYTGNSSVPETLPGESGSLNMTMPGEPVHVSAVFQQASYTITYPEDKLQVVYMENSSPVRSGEQVISGRQLQVKALENYKITQWLEVPEGVDVSGAPQSLSFTMMKDVKLDVTVEKLFTLKVPTVAGARVKVYLDGSPEQSVLDFNTGTALAEGMRVRLAAEAEEGYLYLGWNIDRGMKLKEGLEIEIIMEGNHVVTPVVTAKATENPILTYAFATCKTKANATPVESETKVSPGTELIFTAQLTDSDAGKNVEEWLCAFDVWSWQFKSGTQGVSPGTYQFEYTMPEADVYVQPWPIQEKVSVTVNNGEHGTYLLDCGEGIDPSEVPGGQTVTLTVTPETGYEPVITQDDEAGKLTETGKVGPSYLYRITVGSKDTTINIAYRDVREYRITLANSDLSVGGTFNANAETAKAGETVSLEVTKTADGYQHRSWSVVYSGGTVPVSEGQFIMPEGNVTVYAVFSQSQINKEYSVNLTDDGVAPDDAGTFTATPRKAWKGDTIILNANPATGYVLDSWIVNNGNQPIPVENGAFLMPDADVTVSALFKRAVTYNVILEGEGKATGGTFSANPTAAVEGTKITLSSNPETGYRLDSWKVMAGGQEVTLENDSFTMPASNVTVNATFAEITVEPKEYSVNLVNGGKADGGSFSANPETGKEGQTIELRSRPDTGYKLNSWSVVLKDGGGNIPHKNNRFIMPAGDVIVNATFIREEGGGGGGTETETFIITATAGKGGSIDPSGSVSIEAGGSRTFTITPEEGYQIADVLVDGKSVGPVKAYTFQNVTHNGTITASFRGDGGRLPWNPFEDVREENWFYDDVKYVYEQNLMVGTSSNRFSPYLSTSRGMIVTILWRLEQEPESAIEMTFTDVDPGSYCYEAIRWGQEHQIVKGYSAETFAPNKTIARQELAAIFHRYSQYKGYDISANDDLSGFTDQPSPWAEESVRWAVGEGLIKGKGSGILDPKGNATRGETAAILRRFNEGR